MIRMMLDCVRLVFLDIWRVERWGYPTGTGTEPLAEGVLLKLK